MKVTWFGWRARCLGGCGIAISGWKGIREPLTRLEQWSTIAQHVLLVFNPAKINRLEK